MNNLRMYVSLFILLSIFIKPLFSQEPQTKTYINERFVLAALYAQVSGEFKALQFQAYNIARLRISEYVNNCSLKGNEAIVIDIDEAVLETFAFESKMIVENLKYPEGFNEYLQKSICKPVSGSLDFLKFVDSLGIKIYYVSNRLLDQMDASINNLVKYNYPQVSESNILLKDKIHDKENRRNKIKKDHNILLLIGDSIEDFSNIFQSNTNDERNALVMKYKELFGKKFIVLPNPSYGTWEGLIYGNNWRLPPQEMDSLRKATFKNLYDF